jgi:4'-phosphopantetheinyl transferase
VSTWVVVARVPARSATRDLAELVAEAGGVAPEGVRIGRRCHRCGGTAHGAPRVLAPEDLGLHVSLARSGDWALVTVAGAPVGVDLEVVGPPPGIDDVQLAPGEPIAAGRHGSLRTWTRKEARLKAAGLGLSVDPRTVRVSDDAGLAWSGPGWWLTDLDPTDDLIGALAVATPSGEVPRVDRRF